MGFMLSLGGFMLSGRLLLTAASGGKILLER
jgi:hypothetical protein